MCRHAGETDAVHTGTQLEVWEVERASSVIFRSVSTQGWRRSMFSREKAAEIQLTKTTWALPPC